jgi:hypothetical protein
MKMQKRGKKNEEGWIRLGRSDTAAPPRFLLIPALSSSGPGLDPGAKFRWVGSVGRENKLFLDSPVAACWPRQRFAVQRHQDR